MPPAAIIGIAALAGAAKAYGGRKAQKKQNKYLTQAAGRFNPENLMNWMQDVNPQFLQGYQGTATSGPGKFIADIANQPGYIDPTLMNAPYEMSARRAQNDLVAAQGKLGRSGMTGGLGNAYALANQASRTQRDVGTAQQYGLWREQQKRADLAWLQNMYQQMLSQSMGAASGQAGFLANRGAPTPWATIGGQGLESGLGAYGMAGSMGLLRGGASSPTPRINPSQMMIGWPSSPGQPGFTP